MHGIPCWWSMRLWLHGRGTRPSESQGHQEVRECDFFKKLKEPQKRCGVSGGQVVARIYCYNWFPQIQGGPKEPDLAQLLGWAISHWVSDSHTDIFTGVLMMRF